MPTDPIQWFFAGLGIALAHSPVFAIGLALRNVGRRFTHQAVSYKVLPGTLHFLFGIALLHSLFGKIATQISILVALIVLLFGVVSAIAGAIKSRQTNDSNFAEDGENIPVADTQNDSS